MKTFIVSLLVLFAASVQAERPNILIIMCDDLGYADVGFNGSPDIRTPELDTLAKAGTICTSGYVTHPFCGPSRMGLLSGRYPHTFGGQFNLPPADLGIEEYNRLGIPETETLIGTVLKNAGYYTGAIGKWHLGEDPQYHPNKRGFDDFYGFLGGGHNYFPEQYGPAYERQVQSGKKRIKDYLVPLQHNGKRTTEKEYLTDELSNHAVRFLNTAAKKKNQPFFLYLCYNAPHAPMEAKAEDMALYPNIADKKRRTYAGMMSAVDRGVGLVADALKKNGQFENTLVIFLSDNGGKPSDGASNAPLRGTKGDTWEGGFRVPMFFHWPKNIPAQKFDYPVTSLDFFPTFVKLAGATLPKGKKLDGKDIMAALKNGTNPRKGEMIFSMRHRNSYTDASARRDNWKITRYANQPWRLFNIDEDLSESNDLAAQYPERVKEMVKEAKAWSRTHAEPLWFHAEPARDQWKQNDMPHFDKAFSPEIGAPPLPAVVHITDMAAAPAASAVKIPSAPPGVKLKKGDSTREQFVAREKIKWEQKGWRWDPGKVEANSKKMDANNDGIISGKEKKAYYGTGSAKPATSPKSTPAAKPATPAKPAVKLQKGDSTLEHFLSVRKAQSDKKGQKFNQAGAEKMFNDIDTNGDGIATGQEKKAYWAK